MLYFAKGNSIFILFIQSNAEIQPADKYGLEHTCYERHDAHVQISSNPWLQIMPRLHRAMRNSLNTHEFMRQVTGKC